MQMQLELQKLMHQLEDWRCLESHPFVPSVSIAPSGFVATD
jgi:hypothetical protein